jgi:hypothetical protein
MAWSKMVDMELDDEAKLDAPMPIAMAKKPDYPYGLRICLCKPEIEKLGLDANDCSVGDMIDLRAMGEITCISQDASEHGDSCRVEIQLQRLAVENENTESMED